MNPKDLSSLLVGIVCFATVLFAVTLMRTRRRAWDWWLCVAIVLVSTLVLFALPTTRPLAGVIAFALQLLLIAVPLRLQKAARRAARLGLARRAVVFARVAAWMHPSREFRREPRALGPLLSMREGAVLSEPTLAELSQGDPTARSVLDSLALHAQGQYDQLYANLQDSHTRGALIAAGGGAIVLRVFAICAPSHQSVRATLSEIERLDPTLREADRQALWLLLALACFASVEQTERAAKWLAPYLAAGEATLLCTFCAWRRGDLPAAERWLAQTASENPNNLAVRHSVSLMRQVLLRPHASAAVSADQLNDISVTQDTDATVERLLANAKVLAAIAPLEGRTKGVPWLTYAATGVLVSVYIWCAMRGDPMDAEHLVRSGAVLSLDFTLQHDWWRLLTYGLLHAGLLHLGFNLGALWSFGQFCEAFYGTFRTFAVYLIAGVLGASGSIFALGGAMLAALAADRELRNTPRGRRELTILMVLFATQYFVDHSIPGISSTAHLVGLATGVLLGALLTVLRRFTESRSSSSARRPTQPSR